MSYIVLTVERSTRKLVIKNSEILITGDTNVPVWLYFTDESEAVQLDADEPIAFEAKAFGDYSGDALFSCTTWTRGASVDDPYEGEIDLDSADLISAMGDEATLKCMGEVSWEEGGAIRSSKAATFPVDNDVIKPPTSSDTPMFTPSDSAMFTPTDDLIFQ